MKDIFNTLVASGQTLTGEEWINYILDGIGVDFEPMIIYIIERIESEELSLAEMKSILQKYEQRLYRTSGLALEFNRLNANLVKQTNNVAVGYENVRSGVLSDNNSNVFYASQEQMGRGENIG